MQSCQVVLPGSLASSGASNAAARKYCRAHRIAWPSPCKPLAWSLTGHPPCSVAKLLMIIPVCYSRVSWVLSSDLGSFPGPGQDPYRADSRLPHRLMRNGSQLIHLLLTRHGKWHRLRGEEYCRRLGQDPALMAPQRVMERGLSVGENGRSHSPGRGGRRAPGSGGLARVASGLRSLARGALGCWAAEATLRPPAPRTRRPGGDGRLGSGPAGTCRLIVAASARRSGCRHDQKWTGWTGRIAVIASVGWPMAFAGG